MSTTSDCPNCYTVTYSPRYSGWTSFHSYYPDWMVTMNNSLYTFKSGNLYKHYSNEIRNSYYGDLYPSKLTTIFNNEPSQTKQFKTIATNSTTSWDTLVLSDQGSGFIDSDYYALKEGTWYAYIRRNADDNSLAMISAQGVGNVTTYTSNVLTFTFNIGDIVSDGDSLYMLTGSNIQFCGIITAHTNTTITINRTGAIPVPGSFILYLKSSIAESTATRGTYLEVEFTNNDTEYTEMYMTSSEVFKSYS
jgi:hypothetical protein